MPLTNPLVSPLIKDLHEWLENRPEEKAFITQALVGLAGHYLGRHAANRHSGDVAAAVNDGNVGANILVRLLGKSAAETIRDDLSVEQWLEQWSLQDTELEAERQKRKN
jgi:hypothetical protein